MNIVQFPFDSRLTLRFSREHITALQDADVAIDVNGLVFKHREDVADRQATPEELEQAVKLVDSVERVDLGGGRGLGMYGGPVSDTYSRADVEVQDSSAAEYDACWLRIRGEAHLTGPRRPCAGVPFGIAPGDVSAHLDVYRATQIRDRLDAWIKSVTG